MYSWQNISKLESRRFSCGYCGANIVSDSGYHATDRFGDSQAYIFVCHYCKRPTFFQGDQQTPGAPFGKEIHDITDDKVKELYDEARNSIAANAMTGAVLCCRKLLMNIAVSKGAAENLKFLEYVKYLRDNHFIPPASEEWVDVIRKVGNEATHEIKIMTREDAEDLITFISMLLQLIYEFPATIKRRQDTNK